MCIFWKQLFQWKRVIVNKVCHWKQCCISVNSHILVEIGVYWRFPVSLLFANVLLAAVTHGDVFSINQKECTEFFHYIIPLMNMKPKSCPTATPGAGIGYQPVPFSSSSERGFQKPRSDEKWSLIKLVLLTSLRVIPRTRSYSFDVSSRSKF